jgi:hypothetical protein
VEHLAYLQSRILYLAFVAVEAVVVEEVVVVVVAAADVVAQKLVVGKAHR